MNTQMTFESKIAATAEVKRGLDTLVSWKGSLHNAEFMMLFNTMKHEYERGSEVLILSWSSCKLKNREQHGHQYETLSQYMLREKTQGE